MKRFQKRVTGEKGSARRSKKIYGDMTTKGPAINIGFGRVEGPNPVPEHFLQKKSSQILLRGWR